MVGCWLMGMLMQWPFQEPKLEVPTINIRPMFQAYVREYPQNLVPQFEIAKLGFT